MSSEKVKFRCSSCGQWGVSELYSGGEVANAIAMLGQDAEIDESETYVCCTYCDAWCVVE